MVFSFRANLWREWTIDQRTRLNPQGEQLAHHTEERLVIRFCETLTSSAAARGRDLQIVRTGSHGMFWLEPLLEVETEQGRVGYGAVAAPTARICCTAFRAKAARTGSTWDPSTGLGPDEDAAKRVREARLTRS